jgi:hypothetical protein
MAHSAAVVDPIVLSIPCFLRRRACPYERMTARTGFIDAAELTVDTGGTLWRKPVKECGGSNFFSLFLKREGRTSVEGQCASPFPTCLNY